MNEGVQIPHLKLTMSFAIDAYRTQRLVLRKPEFPADDDFFFRIMQDPILQAQTNVKLQQPAGKAEVDDYKSLFTEQDGKALLAALICLPKEHKENTTAISDATAFRESIGRTRRATAENSMPIGVVLLGSPRSGCAHHRSTMLGIHLDLQFTGQGYGSEAIVWALRWAFQTAGMHRVDLGAFAFNDGAIRLYERMGFVLEGRRREAFWIHGKWCDDLLFGMLEEDWRKRWGEDSS